MFNEEKLKDWIQYMREHPDEFPAFISWFHGITHWEHVEAFGLLLAKHYPAADTEVIRWFAYLHDCRRGSDNDGEEHGRVAAKYIRKIRRTFLSDLSDEQIRVLTMACRFHTTKRRTGDITADICLDADRLDLPRVGIKPEPKKMASDIGAEFAKLTYEDLLKEAGL